MQLAVVTSAAAVEGGVGVLMYIYCSRWRLCLMIHYMPLDTSRFLGSGSENRPKSTDVPKSSLQVVMNILSCCLIVVGIVILCVRAAEMDTKNYSLSDETREAHLIAGCVLLGTGVVGLIVLCILHKCYNS